VSLLMNPLANPIVLRMGLLLFAACKKCQRREHGLEYQGRARRACWIARPSGHIPPGV